MDRHREFEQWINDFVDRLTRLAYTYLQDWAASEDAVQDAFVRAYESRHQLRNPDNPFAWLARIVVNQCRSIRRKSWREVVTALLPDDRKNPSVEDTVVTNEQSGVINESIMALPESLRTPLYLYYFEEMATKEIAQVIGISDGAVRIRLTRARERFATELMRREENEHRGEATASQVSISTPHR